MLKDDVKTLGASEDWALEEQIGSQLAALIGEIVGVDLKILPVQMLLKICW